MSVSCYTAGQANPPFADNGYGDFLTDPSQTPFGDESTLCAACNLTSAEFALITDTPRFNPSTPLTIAGCVIITQPYSAGAGAAHESGTAPVAVRLTAVWFATSPSVGDGESGRGASSPGASLSRHLSGCLARRRLPFAGAQEAQRGW